MAQTRVVKSYGPQGLAHVQVLKKGVRVTFKEDNQVYDLPIQLEKGRQTGDYNVTLSKDKSKIFGLRPPTGEYILQFVQIGNRVVGKTAGSNQPGLPAPKIQKGGMRQRKSDNQWFPAPDQMVFTAVMEVLNDGIYKGLQVFANVPFSFARPAQGDFTDYSDSQRNLENLEAFFMGATGKRLEGIDVRWDDDPTRLLLAYERFLLANQTPFTGDVGDKGFVDLRSVHAINPDLLPKKKATRKAKK